MNCIILLHFDITSIKLSKSLFYMNICIIGSMLHSIIPSGLHNTLILKSVAEKVL